MERHGQQGTAGLLADHAAEVFTQRVERVGLEFGEDASQPLLDPVDRMKESAAIHVELAATEFPVRPQDKVKPEKPVFVIVQHAAADEAKVGKVLFPLARIGPPAIAAAAELQGNRADVIRISGELSKTVETCAENRTKYTVARRFPSIMDKTHTEALAVRARRLRQPYRV